MKTINTILNLYLEANSGDNYSCGSDIVYCEPYESTNGWFQRDFYYSHEATRFIMGNKSALDLVEVFESALKSDLLHMHAPVEEVAQVSFIFTDKSFWHYDVTMGEQELDVDAMFEKFQGGTRREQLLANAFLRRFYATLGHKLREKKHRDEMAEFQRRHEQFEEEHQLFLEENWEWLLKEHYSGEYPMSQHRLYETLQARDRALAKRAAYAAEKAAYEAACEDDDADLIW